MCLANQDIDSTRCDDQTHLVDLALQQLCTDGANDPGLDLFEGDVQCSGDGREAQLLKAARGVAR